MVDTVRGEVRDRVLVEATRLFAAKGVSATSLQQIAEAVGVRKTSLLYYFPSKDELHRAVLENLLARWNDTLPNLLRAAAREDRFDAILDETIAFFAEDPDRARLLLREALDRPDEMRALLETYVTPWLSVIADAIEKGRERGVFQPDIDPEAYVVEVIHLVLGTCATALSVASLTKAQRGSRSIVSPRMVAEIKRMARVGLFAPEPERERAAAE